MHCVSDEPNDRADDGFDLCRRHGVRGADADRAGVQVLAEDADGQGVLGELPTEEEVLPEDPRRALIGRVGVARSKMLPSGAVEIDGQMIDAVTQGQAIEPGTYVVVSRCGRIAWSCGPAGKDQRPSHQNPNDVLSRPIEELGIESLDDPLA